MIFRFKKSNFPFQKKWNSVSIPFHYWQRWILWNHNISKESAVNGPDRQNGTISVVNWRKRAQLAWWTGEKCTINMWMDNERGTAQSTLCVDNKKDKTELAMCDWHLKKKKNCFEFHGFRFKSAIPRSRKITGPKYKVTGYLHFVTKWIWNQALWLRSHLDLPVLRLI